MRLPWDLQRPPAEPPEGCHSPDAWRDAYRLLERHQPGSYGRCRTCDDAWPCPEHKLAVRGLLDAYAPLRPLQFAGPPRIVKTAACRWCDQKIERHSLYGWVHVVEGFILCQIVSHDAPPLCVAEPKQIQ